MDLWCERHGARLHHEQRVVVVGSATHEVSFLTLLLAAIPRPMAGDSTVATLIAVLRMALRPRVAFAASATARLGASDTSGVAGRCSSISQVHPGEQILFREEKLAGMLGLRCVLLLALLGNF